MGFPVPATVGYCTDTAVAGAEFYLMQFVGGRVCDNGLAKAPAEQRGPALFAMVETLASLHAVDPQQVGLTDYGKSGGFYGRQIETMRRVSYDQIGRTNGGVPPLARGEELLGWFAANLPPDLVSIVHGDYKPDNVILHPTEPRVLAVLDWELSTIGHPYSDLANLCLPYHLPSGIPDGLYNKWADAVPSEAEVLQHYCRKRELAFPIEGTVAWRGVARRGEVWRGRSDCER